MNILIAKDEIFENEKTLQVFEGMDDDVKDALWSHFCNYPAPFSFNRAVDNVEIKLTVRQFIAFLPTNENGGRQLVEFFLRWKQHFDGFEKKALDLISHNPKRDEYLFLSSSTFLKNKESWEKKGIDNSGDEIKRLYSGYLDRCREADESLGEYYVINDGYHSKILANKFTHQLYHLIKTMEVSGFANGRGFTLVPLMVKYEDVYETPIENNEDWDRTL